MFNCAGKSGIKMNLDYYDGKDLYSDGDVENDILEIVGKTNDFAEIISRDDRWAVLYHLTDIRKNLLDWFPFE